MRQLFEVKSIERKRIEEYLEYIPSIPLTIVVAGMGYGKTTVIQNFLKNQKKAVNIWLSLGRDEVDDVWIWQRLIEKLKEENFKYMPSIEEFGLPKNKQEIECFIDLIRDLFKKPFYLVVDDFHECNSINLNRLIETIAYAEIPNLHIIIISRIYPSIAYDEMWMKGCCLLIEHQAFILSKKEVAYFFELNGIIPLNKELDLLYDYTDGWMSAAYLALLEYKKNNCLGNLGSISNLLRNSIYEKLPDKLKEIFKKISILDSFTAEEAIFITQVDINPLNLYEWVQEIGFIKYDMTTGAYKMHSLFRAVASVELDKSDYDIKMLYERSGMWYEKIGDLIDAIKYYQKSGNIDHIFSIIEINKCAVLFEKAPVIITSFFKEIPLKVKLEHKYAYLPYLYLNLVKGDHVEGMRLFLEAKEYYEKKYNGQDKKQILGEIKFIESVVQFNNLEAITQCMKEAYQLMDEKHSDIFDSKIVFTYGVPEILTLYHYKVGSLKQTLDLEKEYSYYYMRLINGVEGGWDSLFEAEYQLTTGHVAEAEVLANIACEKAKFRKQICIIISSYFVLLRCDIFLGRKIEFEERMKELEKEMLGESRSLLIIDYDLVTSYLYGCVRQIHKMAGWLQDFQLDECNNIIRSVRGACVSYGILLKERKQWILLEALAEEMLMPYRKSVHIYVMIRAQIYRCISAYYLYGLQKAKERLLEAIELAQPDAIVLPFIENSLDLYVIMQEMKENAYIQHMLPLCDQYKKGIAVFFGTEKEKILTRREEELMKLVIEGCKNTEISQRLNIALVTVEKTLTNIYRKLNVTNRMAAATRFRDLGL